MSPPWAISLVELRLEIANAAFKIIDEMTITFVDDSNGSVLEFDSHLHLPNGALLAKCKRDDIEDLLNWLEAKLCTVTFVKFNWLSRVSLRTKLNSVFTLRTKAETCLPEKSGKVRSIKDHDSRKHKLCCDNGMNRPLLNFNVVN